MYPLTVKAISQTMYKFDIVVMLDEFAARDVFDPQRLYDAVFAAEIERKNRDDDKYFIPEHQRRFLLSSMDFAMSPPADIDTP